MNDLVLAAAISAVISIFVAFMTYISASNRIEAETQALEKELQRKLTDRLYDLRIKHYPEAFIITDKLGKQKGHAPEDLPALYKEIGSQLRKWKSGEPSFIMSEDALNRYYEVIEALKANLALGTKYNDQQLERIWQVRTAFRNQLREDVGLLFQEETDSLQDI